MRSEAKIKQLQESFRDREFTVELAMDEDVPDCIKFELIALELQKIKELLSCPPNVKGMSCPECKSREVYPVAAGVYRCRRCGATWDIFV